MTVGHLHLVLGDEALLTREAVDRIVAAGLEGGAPSLNLSAYEAGGGASGALSVARTLPMMGKRRVVVVREMEKAPAALLDALCEYAGNPNPSTVLVLTGEKLPGKTEAGDRGARLLELVRARGEVQSFQAGDQRPVPFATEHARSIGCRLDPAAAVLLVELCGSDLGRLRQEVEKAAAFVGGQGEIGPQAIEATCSVVAEGEIWDLTDAVVRRDADKALAAAHRLLEQAGPSDGGSHKLLAMITWQVRNLLLLQYAQRVSAPLPDAWKRMPRSKLQAAQTSLARHPLRADRILDALSKANRAFNRSRAGDRRVFEALVLALTAGG